MSLKEAFGFDVKKKIRYAIVGLGDIAQQALMPGVEHTGNSEITALVTGDPEKAKALSERYGVSACYSYGEFENLLHSGMIDAIYLATPNWRHSEFAVPALQAGIHVLLEKPMEVSSAKCEEILAAQKSSGAKLMIAYRLHFEPATLSILDLVRSGKLGTLRFFSSSFAQSVKPENHRATSGRAAGPLFDMAPYPINAVRNIFSAEPAEVSAVAVQNTDAGLGDLEDTVAVTLKFPENRLAQFVVSYAGSSLDTFTVVGSEGALVASPAFTYSKPLEYDLITAEKKKHESFKATDQFGGELKYFSECILADRNPEPDGEEGLLDVRVIEAIYRALDAGTPQTLAARQRTNRMNSQQKQELGAVKPPEPVNAERPSR